MRRCDVSTAEETGEIRKIHPEEAEAEDVRETPVEISRAIDEDSRKSGGPWAPPVGHEGSIGQTMFDAPTSKDGTVTVLFPEHKIDSISNQALVEVRSLKDSKTYIGAVVEGPFAEPDGMRADATPIVVSTVHGGLFIPKYHGRAQIEIIGERIQDGSIIPPKRRPKPSSPVFPLGSEETARVLKIGGDFRIGLADGFDDLEVRVSSKDKSVFPRHFGILGTTGGGKSTTVSGFIAKAEEANMAVVIIDTEGEYCGIGEPTKDEKMKTALEQRGLNPQGVKDVHVYHLVGKATKSINPATTRKFSLRFSNISPYVVQEILDLNEAQEDRFFKAYDLTRKVMEDVGIWPITLDDKTRSIEWDEFDDGYPNMKLEYLYDVVAQIATNLNKKGLEEYTPKTKEFMANLTKFRSAIEQASAVKAETKDPRSWWKVQGKLGKYIRLKVFDMEKKEAPPLDFAEMLTSGRVNIIDLSDTDSPQINNLVIAELLRGVQIQQDKNYEEASKKGRKPTPTAVFIEEAHEFLSAQRIGRMRHLFEQVARIAKRGRKRWLGLVFITQLPQHLPDEVLGLINNWVLHKISDPTVVHRLRGAVGNINDALWKRLSSLAPGQAIVSISTMARPLQVSIDPTPCNLLMTD
jgi:hypothetical protein